MRNSTVITYNPHFNFHSLFNPGIEGAFFTAVSSEATSIIQPDQGDFLDPGLKKAGGPQAQPKETPVPGPPGTGGQIEADVENKPKPEETEDDEPGGATATVNEFVTVDGPHFTVEVNGLQTHQIKDLKTKDTTIEIAVNMPEPVARKKYIIPNPEAANCLQIALIGKDTGKYNLQHNSCLSHCAMVLQAGGSKETTIPRESI